MNTRSSAVRDPSVAFGLQPPAGLHWTAVIAGLVAALAVEIILMMLGAGLGLAAFNPASDGDAASSFGTGAAVI